MMDDASLLKAYADEGSQSAMAELVQRHMGTVYSAAMRRLAGDNAEAADVTQRVFVSLARNAKRLAGHPALVAWLHTATRNAAFDTLKARQRRQAMEAEVVMNTHVNDEQGLDWSKLRPVIDSALDQLCEGDRQAILLRYFEGASFREVGHAMHMSEDAARMRTDRALDKLRRILSTKGLSSTSAALGLAIAQNGAIAAPAGLSAAVIAHAITITPAAATWLTTLAMSKFTLPIAASIAVSGLTLIGWASFAPSSESRNLDRLGAGDPALTQPADPNAPAVHSGDEGGRFAQPRETRKLDRLGTHHQNVGMATVQDAYLTAGWASDVADAEVLAKMLWFDPAVREKALQTMAEQSAALVEKYPTPEKFYGFVIAAICLEAPPPAADILRQDLARPLKEIGPGRVMVKPNHEYQQTEEGWKWVFPEVGIKSWLHVLGDSVLTSAVEGPRPEADYLNQGQATPVDTLQTFAWACDQGDTTLMQQLITFEPAARPKAEAFLASLPPEVRAKTPTIESLAALYLVEDGMRKPFPRATLLARGTVESLGEDRVRMRLPGTPRDGGIYARVGDEWKFVITEESVDKKLAAIQGRK